MRGRGRGGIRRWLGAALAGLALAFAIPGDLNGPSPAAARGPQAAPVPEFRVVRRLEHPYYVFWVAWSPDGKRLAAAGMLDRRVTIWDPQAGRVVRVLDRQKGGVNALAYSPDGKHLAAGRGFVATLADKNVVTLWDAQTGALVREIPSTVVGPMGDRDVGALAFSPDGRLLAATFMGQTLLYEVPSGRQTRRLATHTRAHVGAVAFAPAGDELATGEVGGEVDIWNVATGKSVRRFRAHSSLVTALAYFPWGGALASATNTGVITERHDATTGQMTRNRVGDGVRLWDASAGSLERELSGHDGAVHAIGFLFPARAVVFGSLDRRLWIWPHDASQPPRSIAGHDDLIQFIALSPDGQWLAAAGGPRVSIWAATRDRP